MTELGNDTLLADDLWVGITQRHNIVAPNPNSVSRRGIHTPPKEPDITAEVRYIPLAS